MNIDFEDLDYTKMMCNVMSLSASQDPSEVYSHIFKKYEEFLEPTPEVDRKKLFRYIPLVYDKNCPLHTVIPDIKKLKGKAAELAGFRKQDDGTFLKNVENIMSCDNREVNFMIIRYVILHKSAKYQRFVVLNEVNVGISERILREQNLKDIDGFSKLGDQLDEIKQDLLSGDNNEKLEESLYEYYFENELALRPEAIAKKLQELKRGETIVPPPEKKKPKEVAQKVLNQYEKEDEWAILNIDPALHPIWIKLPECEDITQIDGYGLPAKDQFFVKPEMPPKLVKLINDYDKIDEIWAELDNNALLYKKEVRWIKDQIYYSHYGYWFFNNGKPTYLIGWHYDYLNHWHFSGGASPEYRDRDRKWYHGWYYAYTTTEQPALNELGRLEYEDVEKKRLKMIDVFRKVFMGAIGPKGRRAGDSNKFLCALYMETQRHMGKNSDIISSTGGHAKDTLFDEILVPAWQQEPFFYKPITSSNENPEKEIKFVGSRKRADSAVVSGQLKSKMSVSSTSSSGQLDGGKEFFLLADEGGKTIESDVFERHQQLKETVSQGAGINIVGFIGMPSTVGEMEGNGGKQYEKLCSQSYFEKRVKSGQTSTGLLLIYISCLEGMEGFIGRYGESVIETPTREQAEFIDKSFGAREHIDSKRKSFLDDKDLDGYNEFVRLFPIDYRECFRTKDGEIGFNSVIINDSIDILVGQQRDLCRFGEFKRVHDLMDSEVYWEDALDPEKAKWCITEHRNHDQTNRHITRKVEMYGEVQDQRFPIDPKYTSSGDAFAAGKPKGTRVSLGGGAILKDYDASVDGGKNVRDWITHDFVATYLARPLKQSEFLEDILMGDIYFGSMQFPENNIKDIGSYYEKRGYAGYLRYGRDPNTGLYLSTPGFDSLAKSKQQIFNRTRDYIQDHAHRTKHLKLLEQWKDIKYMDQMTDYDLLTAAGGCLLGTPPIMHLFRTEKVEEEKKKTMLYPMHSYRK